MSEPTRWEVEKLNCCFDADMVQSPTGEYVLYEDYAHLKTEVERLTAELDKAECDHDNCQKRKVSIDNHRFDLFTENKTLKSDVERLRKAGDMCDQLLACFEMEGRKGVNIGRDMWRAAKEGKPSV